MKIRRDRKVKKGVDYEKVTRIWNALAESTDWLHLAEVSRRTKINRVTVGWYLDHYFKNFIDEEAIIPSIKLRLVKLKQDADFKKLIKFIEVLNKIKKIKEASKIR